MRLYTPEGDIPFRTFTFPDGQQHVELQARPDFDTVTIEAPIRNAEELMDVLLARDALAGIGKNVHLNIRYLLGARMDRRISPFHAATLSVVARTLLAAGFARIRVLDPHSNAALALLNAVAVYPRRALRTVFASYDPEQTLILAPDAGSTERVQNMLYTRRGDFVVLQGGKKRDPRTGEITGFELINPLNIQGKDVLILDDICDGGRTFVGMAEVLHELGVINVDLFVTHGIFSKSVPLKGIRQIWTTDSYTDIEWQRHFDSFAKIIPVRMQDEV